MRTEQIIYDNLLNMMETTPYTKIKVSDFVKCAGISRSSFYFYFSSIEAAVDQMEDDFVSLMPDPVVTASNLASKPADCTYDFIKQCNAKVEKKLRVFRILSSPNGSPNFQRKLCERVRQINALFYGAANTDLFMDFLSEYYAGAQWGMYCWWARHEGEVSLADINEFASRIPTSLSDLTAVKSPEGRRKR